MDPRPILYFLGILLTVLAFSMSVPMLADLVADHPDWQVFFSCMILTGFFGGALILSNSGQDFDLNIRQIFLLTVISWVGICIFASLPFSFSELDLAPEEAFFEAVSGITTTGATLINDLDSAPPGILLWRSILQWLGGIGIIVMALSVLPFLKVGGMQLFKTESSESEKALPRATKLASSLILIYVSMSLICASLYMFAGMTPFDAFNHAMTTLSTGGFSTHSASIKHFDSIWIELIAVSFMVLSGMPFVLFLKALRGNPNALFNDSQVHAFLFIIFCSVSVLSVCLVFWDGYSVFHGIRGALFTAVSVMTGTGYNTDDFALWGGFANSVLLFLMVVGGCAGSTTCGIKIFRFQVLYEVTKSQVKSLIYPHGVFMPQYNNRTIPSDAVISVMSFFFSFAILFVIGVLILSFIGLDFLTAISAACTALSNVGPGLGSIIGPTGSFYALPEAAKWVLSIYMIIGRLELFTVLILFSPHFWRH